MSAMSEVVIFIKNLQDGTNQINTVIADILKAAGVSDGSQITNIEEKGTAEQPEAEIKKVEETPNPEAAPETQEPAAEPTPEGQTDTDATETPAEEPPVQSSDENPAETTSDSSEPVVVADARAKDIMTYIDGKKFKAGQTITPEEAIALLAQSKAAPNAKAVKIPTQAKPVIYTSKNKSLLGRKVGLNIGAFADGKVTAIKQNTDGTIVLEYAVEDEEPIDPVVASWYNK